MQFLSRNFFSKRAQKKIFSIEIRANPVGEKTSTTSILRLLDDLKSARLSYMYMLRANLFFLRVCILLSVQHKARHLSTKPIRILPWALKEWATCRCKTSCLANERIWLCPSSWCKKWSPVPNVYGWCPRLVSTGLLTHRPAYTTHRKQTYLGYESQK